jgi:hypothetical protein
MDAVKSKSSCKCGVGGFKCPCCRPYSSKVPLSVQKARLNRYARRTLKLELSGLVDGEFNDVVERK